MYQTPINTNVNNEVETTQVVREETTTTNEINHQIDSYVDYKEIFKTLVPLIDKNKDLVNFSYFLHKMRYVDTHEQEDDAWLAINHKVNFCDCSKEKSFLKSLNSDRLSQQYVIDIFCEDFYTFSYRKKVYLPNNILNTCSDCRQGGADELPFCPYWLTYIIDQYGKNYCCDPELIYDSILGQNKIAFRGTDVFKISCYIEPKDYEGVDSKSAYSAYLLLASNLFRVHEKTDKDISYTYFPSCRGDLRSNIISDVIDFWKTSSGVFSTISLEDMSDILHSKTQGCRKCNFEQCPHKLAAYFVLLAEKYNTDPIDLGYCIATKTTHAGINIGQHFKYNEHYMMAMNSSMTEESKAEYCKMLNYIVARKRNRKIPFLPFNTVVLSEDRNYGRELADNFSNVIWFFDYYRKGTGATHSKSLYLAAMSFNELYEEYANVPDGTTIYLYDMHLMCGNETFQKEYHKLFKKMQDREDQIMSILVGKKEDVYQFFGMFPEFKNKIFTKELVLRDMSPENVTDKLMDKLEETFTIPREVEYLLRHYIDVAYPSSVLKSIDYVNNLYEKLLFNHYNQDVDADNVLQERDIPYIKPPRSEQEIFEEINKLTGLENVKQELKTVNDLVRFNLKMGKVNKNSVNLHMVFSGNPGTGKTTVARLVAEILHSIGFIRENKVVTCSAKDLIGRYAGQTAPTTAKKCEQAYNGVLFIDEAYQLNPYTGYESDTFKEECIAELIQQMENHREKLIVIFAGYTDEMEDFLNRANTGLRSRIGKILEFPDYSSEELFEIFENIVIHDGMTLGEGVREKTIFYFEKAKENAKRFGNARYARNMYERSRLRHAAVKANLEADDPKLRILESSEIVFPEL